MWGPLLCILKYLLQATVGVIYVRTYTPHAVQQKGLWDKNVLLLVPFRDRTVELCCKLSLGINPLLLEKNEGYMTTHMHTCFLDIPEQTKIRAGGSSLFL